MRGPHPQSHMTLQYRSRVTDKKRCISTFTRPMDPKPSRVVTQDEGKSHVTLRHREHLNNKKCYISTSIQYMDPKRSRVVTQNQRNPPTKSRDISIVWSRDKSQDLDEAQDPQTQQDGDQNKKTPANMSCVTLITSSCDNYLQSWS